MTDPTKAIKDALEAGVTDCGAWRWWPCKAGDYKPANDYAQLASGQAQVAQIRIQSVTEADLRYIAACSPHAIRSLLSRLEEAESLLERIYRNPENVSFPETLLAKDLAAAMKEMSNG